MKNSETAIRPGIGNPEDFSPSAATVAVYGAGIAGLTVAHELTRLNYKVSVYEATPDAGGFFRSARLARNQFTQYKPQWLRVISSIDDKFFSVGAPHFLDLFLGGVLAVTTAALGL